jgi:ubiquinone/menaquinone biosynthesis C-methylase UbiE
MPCAPNHREAGCGGKAIGFSAADLNSDAAAANLNLRFANPVAIGRLQPAVTDLDIGSGAGFDSFLAAARVGPQGRAIGVDMTPEMTSKARQNADTVKAANVSFRLVKSEHLPVADASVDTIVSNCL